MTEKMGGYGTLLAETTNFRWLLVVNCSNEYNTHRIEIVDKRNEAREIELRQSSWKSECDTDADRFKAMDEAVHELGEESRKGWDWHKLSEEQKTLAQMFSEIQKLSQENDRLKQNFKMLGEKIAGIISASENRWI